MPISYSDISPLRYPGSKAFLVDYIDSLLTVNYLDGCKIIEPFAGSAIVSMELLRRGTIADSVLIERDPMIYAFWKSVFYYTYDFVERVYNLDVSLDTWHKFQKYRAIDPESSEGEFDRASTLTLGLAGLFFNRTNFSGILNAGPIGGKNQRSQYKIDCRFNKDKLIRSILELSRYSDSVSVYYGDAISVLKGRSSIIDEQCFVYADPPYYKKGKELYRYWYDDEGHSALAGFLTKLKSPWLVSYDNHENIRRMYGNGVGKWKVYIDYSIATAKRKKGCELIISNLPVPPQSRDLSWIEVI